MSIKFKINDKVKLPSGKIIKILKIIENKGLYQYEVDFYFNSTQRERANSFFNEVFNIYQKPKYIDIKRVDEKGKLTY